MQRFFIFIFFLFATLPIYGQQVKSIQLIEVTIFSSENNKAIEGATVKVGESNFVSDEKGVVRLTNVNGDQAAFVSHVGFHGQRILLAELIDNPIVVLKPYDTVLDDVMISTGYYTLPKERSTGSFTIIDKNTLDKSISFDVFSKLEGVTPSLHFDRRFDRTELISSEPEIRVRGLSTINSETKPLIILDNYAFEGDIDLINPEDIESISIAKDAAAASIWGARASNGVIVITTKKGRFNSKPRITVSSGLTIGEKPNLNYDPRFLNSKETISAERLLFENGVYMENDHEPLSPVVELLILARDGHISADELEMNLASLKTIDVREDGFRYMYRTSNAMQHALGINGGGESYNYYVSLGYDRNLESIIGDDNDRLTLTNNNTFKLSKSIALNTRLTIAQQNATNNGIGLHTPGPGSRTTHYTYARLKDGKKNLPVLGKYRSSYIANAESEGLLDWQYRPLDEVELNDERTRHRYLNLSTTLSVEPISDLKIDAHYNYQLSGNYTETLHDRESYYVRDLVNRYTQNDGTMEFPYGEVYFMESGESKQHLGRLQLNYNKSFNRNQQLNVIMGAEVRQVKYRSGPKQQILGYDEESLAFNKALDYVTRHQTRPEGRRATLPPPPNVMQDLTDRFISYYSNAAYDFDARFVINGSLRWDASNLFGVNVNQKGVPLWSVGLGWHLANEEFYKSELISKLSLRATYGINGNVNNSVSAFPAIRYLYDSSSQIQTGNLVSPGNTNLKWEKTKITNLGLDFGFKQNRLAGSIDYYWKDNTDLLGKDIFDPTVGLSVFGGANISYLVNYADMVTKGFDVDVSSRNIVGDFSWSSKLVLSHVSNKITRYHDEKELSTYDYLQGKMAPPHKGVSRDIIYSLPWYGLDPENGNQYGLSEGELSHDYAGFIMNIPQDELIKHDSSVPVLTGSLGNSFTYKNFDLNFNITWKSGYHFRRSSIFYQQFASTFTGHRDFLDRWTKPGDELTTNIPAMPERPSTVQDNAYRYSEILIEKGDHIRLRDIHLGYRFKRLYVQAYARNLGILWRANDHDLDPDFPEARYPAMKTIGLKLKASF